MKWFTSGDKIKGYNQNIIHHIFDLIAVAEYAELTIQGMVKSLGEIGIHWTTWVIVLFLKGFLWNWNIKGEIKPLGVSGTIKMYAEPLWFLFVME